MHLSAEYAFCVMSLQCSAFGNIALHIVFATYACIHICMYAYCVCNICMYADSICNMHCIVFSLAVHCIINVALHCGKVQRIALLVTVTFIALHL